MNALRQSGIRLLSAVFFAALLLVPLVESGHSHARSDLAKPCVVCVAAHHTPAATTPTLSVVAPIAFAAVAVFPSISAPLRRDHSPQSGRAPPASFSDRV